MCSQRVYYCSTNGRFTEYAWGYYCCRLPNYKRRKTVTLLLDRIFHCSQIRYSKLLQFFCIYILPTHTNGTVINCKFCEEIFDALSLYNATICLLTVERPVPMGQYNRLVCYPPITFAYLRRWQFYFKLCPLQEKDVTEATVFGGKKARTQTRSLCLGNQPSVKVDLCLTVHHQCR